MRFASLNTEISILEWMGDDYPYDEEDIDTFLAGEIVEVLREAESNEMGKLFVIFSPRLNESTVVWEGYLNFTD